MKNKFVIVISVYLMIVVSPWIWLSNTYGLNNIPHYDLVMWIFMELYALIAALIGLGITLVALSDGEEEPPKKKKKRNGTKTRSGIGTNKQQPKKKEKKLHVKHSEKPKKPRKPAASKEKSVEPPAEWEQRDYE